MRASAGDKSAVVSVPMARAMFVRGQGLLEDPGRETSGAGVLSEIERLGFVQVDSINIVERAHHHILWSRRHGYRPGMLEELRSGRRVFEHWTHDASIIPTTLFPHWRRRFRAVESWSWSNWLHQKLGDRRDAVLAEVLERVRAEGPRMARDFENDGHTSGPWWDWKPAKAALEYWWRAGRLAIARRENFHKVYDLTERVLPDVHALPETAEEAHVEWACRGALERLGVATARELSAFWNAVPAGAASAWCDGAVERGEVVRVSVEGRPAFAPRGWVRVGEAALEAARDPGLRGRMCLLSPFDPLVRDRARCLRLFGFDYRFEAFVPEKKRRYGYYVLPILEHTAQGPRLVGRLDPKVDREAGVLVVRRVWWEPGVKPTRARMKRLEAALGAYAAFNGAGRVNIVGSCASD